MKYIRIFVILLLLSFLSSCLLNVNQIETDAFNFIGNLEYIIIDSEENLKNYTDNELKEYDEKFFEENAILGFSLQANSGSIVYKLKSIKRNDNSLIISIKENSPSICTDDLRRWVFVVSVRKQFIKDIQTCSLELIKRKDENRKFELKRFVFEV